MISEARRCERRIVLHFGCFGGRFMGIHFCEFDPAQAGRWGQIDLIQICCPRLFRSSPMPGGYRSVSVGNPKTFRDKFRSNFDQNCLARSGQLLLRVESPIPSQSFLHRGANCRGGRAPIRRFEARIGDLRRRRARFECLLCYAHSMNHSVLGAHR